MASEQHLKNDNPLQKEFQNLLEKDFQDRKLKENEIIKATVTETQEEMTGYITGKIKGGFIATVEGLPCFMPSSQIDVRPLKKVDHLMNTPVKVIATRIDKNRGNVCVSRRAVLEKSKNAEISEALKNIKVDDIVENAIVKATTHRGIFLDINGIDALLHDSDLSHGRVKKSSDLVTIGIKIKVKITKIDEKTKGQFMGLLYVPKNKIQPILKRILN